MNSQKSNQQQLVAICFLGRSQQQDQVISYGPGADGNKFDIFMQDAEMEIIGGWEFTLGKPW